MDHYLLQNWLAWWQSNGLALTSLVASFEKNALSALWRDIGNFITGVGAGWAATRDAFFNLVGWDVPASQPQSGGDAVRDTLGSLIHQIFEGISGGESGSTTPSGSSGTTPSSTFQQPPLSDLLPADMGGKTTLADVVGESGSTTPSSSSNTTSPVPFQQPPLSDLLPEDMGGKTTLSDVVDAAKGNQGKSQ